MKVHVAGMIIKSPQGVVEDYTTSRSKTLKIYDCVGGSRFDHVNHALIKATRVFSSRISEAESDWFQMTARFVTWFPHSSNHDLVSADPEQRGELFDEALMIWDVFSRAAPVRVADAKISKVLHAMRPHMFPVLDSRIRLLYRQAAKEAAVSLQMEGPDGKRIRYAYWAAIRRDLQSNRDALERLRGNLSSSEVNLARVCGKTLSDVRLLDILAWSL